MIGDAGKGVSAMLNKLVVASSLLFLLGIGISACGTSGDVGEDEDTASAQQAAQQFCGGFGGFPCPDGFVCVDDPSDDCDPDEGGADCGGVCRKARKPNKDKCDHAANEYLLNDPAECALVHFICIEGYEPFFDDCGCGCTPVQGTPCGGNVCGAGEFCCNESCGICAPEGGGCIQIFCGSPL
jgi:hypothetical protein